jgi:hypothetical protein
MKGLAFVSGLDENQMRPVRPDTGHYPSSLSSDSHADLKDHLDLFLQKTKRQADKAVAQRHGRDPDEE